jgi:gas vesicle protein
MVRKILLFGIGILSGGVLGALLALLLAPKPGIQTQMDISEFFDRLGKDVEGVIEEPHIVLERFEPVSEN